LKQHDYTNASPPHNNDRTWKILVNNSHTVVAFALPVFILLNIMLASVVNINRVNPADSLRQEYGNFIWMSSDSTANTTARKFHRIKFTHPLY